LTTTKFFMVRRVVVQQRKASAKASLFCIKIILILL
jgi:hypothetical protein